jgi:hypothetical protein
MINVESIDHELSPAFAVLYNIAGAFFTLSTLFLTHGPYEV